MKSLKTLGEFGLIEEIRRWTRTPKHTLCGIGDDAAVLRMPLDQVICFTTDTLVENVHFLRTAPAERVGWKAMAVNVSDAAAMGAQPRFAVISLVLAPWVHLRYVRKLYSGLLTCARTFGLALVGGDTVKGKSLTITVSLLASAPQAEVVYRGGARPGHVLFVTGRLGGSLGGRHLSFKPRLAEGRYLARHFRPSAMIDISDGLLQDMEHLLHASGVGAQVRLERIPVHGGRKKSENREKMLWEACGGGEDFELLFTLPCKKEASLMKAWARRFRTPLTPIGVIIRSPRKLLLTDNGSRVHPAWAKRRGFCHF